MPNATCALTGGLSGPSLGAQTRTQVGLHKPSEENERSEIALDCHLILGFARYERPVHDFPLWPMVLSVLGPGILVSAIARHDSLGVYAAGVVVTPDWMVSISSLAPAISITLHVRTQNASGSPR